MTSSSPSLEAYLALLPNGIASYPHMSAKASLVRAILEDLPCSLGPGTGLPPELEALVRSPPPASHWVREVELWALHLCVYDRGFADRGGAAAYDAWTYARNRALMTGPLYKILFAVLSPERLFVGATQRYGAFHRGTGLSRVESSKNRASFHLRTPPHVLPDLASRGLAAGLRAALDVAGARDPEVKSKVDSPEAVSFVATWR